MIKKLEGIGAKRVYDNVRTIITLDTENKYFLKEKDKLIRVTDEGTIKVTMHVHQSDSEIKAGIKFKTSRLKETMDFFHEMGLNPISKVKAARISLGENQKVVNIYVNLTNKVYVETIELIQAKY